MRKPNLPKTAGYIGNGPESTVFVWKGKMYRFAQGRRGGTIYRARPQQLHSLVGTSYFRRRAKRGY